VLNKLPRPRHVLVRFPLFFITADSDVVMICKEDVEGADSERHEMDILGPHTSSVANSLRLASTSQDINYEAQPIVSQAEGVTSICPCCLFPRQLFYSVIGSGRRDRFEMNIDPSRSREGVSGTANDGPTQAEAQIRTYFLTIVEISMT
jgi:hypothetical protein